MVVSVDDLAQVNMEGVSAAHFPNLLALVLGLLPKHLAMWSVSCVVEAFFIFTVVLCGVMSVSLLLGGSAHHSVSIHVFM